MNHFIHQLQAFLESDEASRCAYDEISPAEMLFEFYSQARPPETPQLHGHRERVVQLTSHLSYREQDDILCAVNALCAEQEKYAMIEGIRLGAGAILALSDTITLLESPCRDKGRELD